MNVNNVFAYFVSVIIGISSVCASQYLGAQGYIVCLIGFAVSFVTMMLFIVTFRLRF